MTAESTTVRNVRPWGQDAADIRITEGVIADVAPASGELAPGDIDGDGLLALPGLVNAHSHVDKTWWGRPWVSHANTGAPSVDAWSSSRSTA